MNYYKNIMHEYTKLLFLKFVLELRCHLALVCLSESIFAICE